MTNNNKTLKTFLQDVAPWITGYQISLYLKGRDKPVTAVTVCSVQPGVLIGRWNSSTHLIPLDAIAYIRFAPDCDPCRDPTHPLHATVQSHRPGDRRGQPPAKPYRFENKDTVPIKTVIEDLIKQKHIPKGGQPE